MYLDKIKALSKITITEICKDLKVDRSNLLKGKSKKNERKVYEEIIKRYEEIKNK